jgi:hypothetical protein
MSFQQYQKQKEEQKNIKFEKRKLERNSTPDEIFFIFEKTLQDWLPIKIFNVLIQQNPSSNITQKDVKNIHNGNVRILPNEIDNEKYKLYLELREKVYEKHIKEKELKKITKNEK